MRFQQVVMATSTLVPTTVSSAAKARIAELGLNAQVERMIDYARENLPSLSRIEVSLNERDDEEAPPGVAVAAYSREEAASASRIFWDLASWATAEFPPEVLEHLHLSYRSETRHG
jgi:hypothetical protein